MDCGAVHRPAVTEQDDVADRLLYQEPVEEFRPLVLAAPEVDAVGKSPEHTVAAIEVYPVDGVAAFRERRSEPLEKSGRQSLKEQKGALARLYPSVREHHSPAEPVM